MQSVSVRTGCTKTHLRSIRVPAHQHASSFRCRWSSEDQSGNAIKQWPTDLCCSCGGGVHEGPSPPPPRPPPCPPPNTPPPFPPSPSPPLPPRSPPVPLPPSPPSLPPSFPPRSPVPCNDLAGFSTDDEVLTWHLIYAHGGGWAPEDIGVQNCSWFSFHNDSDVACQLYKCVLSPIRSMREARRVIPPSALLRAPP